jgi:hypothetical protein
MNEKIFSQLDNEALWLLYADAEQELKERNLVRTRNIVGERGEFLAIDMYKSTSGLVNLQAAPEGTQNIDAISRNGERYSIKTVTFPSTTTGVFHGMGNINNDDVHEKRFEYLIIVQLYKNYRPKLILELTWNQFLKLKKWHKTMNAWNINITKKLISEARVILNSSK